MFAFVRSLTLATAALLAAAPAARADPPIVIFAAASLKTALDQAAADFKAETGVEAKISYGGSLALARQIESGAPVDIFLSADEDSMDDAQSKNAIKAESRFDFLSNHLVLIAPKATGPGSVALTAEGIAAALGPGKLATGEVTTVPVGKYAKAALEKLGAWSVVEPRLAMTDNVRAALAFVARGEAPLGIVYSTDANAEPSVKVVATFPDDSHPPIVYPVALTASAANAADQTFLDFLRSEKGRKFFEAQGFVTLD